MRRRCGGRLRGLRGPGGGDSSVGLVGRLRGRERFSIRGLRRLDCGVCWLRPVGCFRTGARSGRCAGSRRYAMRCSIAGSQSGVTGRLGGYGVGRGTVLRGGRKGLVSLVWGAQARFGARGNCRGNSLGRLSLGAIWRVGEWSWGGVVCRGDRGVGRGDSFDGVNCETSGGLSASSWGVRDRAAGGCFERRAVGAGCGMGAVVGLCPT